MGCVPGCVRSCSPVTDPPRSNQASFEVACITKSQNIQHAIRPANTMVFSIDSSLNICFEERISPQMRSGQDFNNPFTNHTHYPPHTHRGGWGGHPTPLTHPHPQGGTLPLGVGGGCQALAHISASAGGSWAGPGPGPDRLGLKCYLAWGKPGWWGGKKK